MERVTVLCDHCGALVGVDSGISITCPASETIQIEVGDRMKQATSRFDFCNKACMLGYLEI